ncbi:MAG: hypothetical protein HC906_02975 [Bacteroidales bacterium]|nr:hypothetical protein [Bacteroidales bacterium]
MDYSITHFEVIIAAIAFIWGISSFIMTRNKELAWKKTEFIIQQSQILDSDVEMREITLILYGIHPEKTIEDFLELTEKKKTSPENSDFVLQFEKYLNFIWRISYAFLVLKPFQKRYGCFWSIFQGYLHP